MQTTSIGQEPDDGAGASTNSLDGGSPFSYLSIITDTDHQAAFAGLVMSNALDRAFSLHYGTL